MTPIRTSACNNPAAATEDQYARIAAAYRSVGNLISAEFVRGAASPEFRAAIRAVELLGAQMGRALVDLQQARRKPTTSPVSVNR